MNTFRKNPVGTPRNNNQGKQNNQRQGQNNKNNQNANNNTQNQNTNNNRPNNNSNKNFKNGNRNNSNNPNNPNNRNKQNQNNNRNFNNNRNNHRQGGEKLNMRPEDQVTKMFRLFDEYKTKRRIYFESYHKLNESQKSKIENEIYQLLRNFRSTENFINDRFSKRTQTKVPENPLDLAYSNNHPLSEEDKNSFKLPEASEIVDPHLTAEQANRAREEYLKLNDESIGSVDDYIKFRNEKPLK